MIERIKQKSVILLPVLVSVTTIALVSVFWIQQYRQVAYEHISQFCEIIGENYPETEEQMLSAVKEYYTLTEQEVDGNQYLVQYGYTSHGFCNGMEWNLLVCSLILFFGTVCSFLLSMGYLSRRKQKRIVELTDYLEQVNMGTGGRIIQRLEDEFSGLQDEMDKTVTELYETRESAVKDKINFADNLANIAHQLKTPITAAFLSLQLMEKEMPGMHTETIKKPLERLNHLEESLLTLSKIDAGILHLEHSPVDIYTALNLAAENLSDLLKQKNVTVEIPDKGCIEIIGDLEWSMEALMNLMKNCMEHSPTAGTIHCDYGSNPLYAEIFIWDEGDGFAPEDIPHLFQRFYRGKRSVGDGMGIGLSLAQSIFELQNGNITARNLPSGGACFEIRVYSH